MNKIREFFKLKAITNFISLVWWDVVKNPFDNTCFAVKYFFQRLFRGYDDTELWNLDEAFYKWIRLRLQAFIKATKGYPNTYISMSSWQKELTNRVAQIDLILKYDYVNFDFPDSEVERYVSKKTIEQYHKDGKDDFLKCVAYNNCVTSFNKWFSKNVNNLWY